MKIQLNEIEEKALHNFKGGLKHMNARIFDDNKVKIMRNSLPSGASIGKHAHTDSSEIIFILSGKAEAICNGATEILEAGSCHYCPKGDSHELKNAGEDDLVFLAVVPIQ